MNTLSCKGYNARVAFDDGDGLFVGRMSEVHGKALPAAQVAGKSLNQWATEVLQGEVSA